MLRLPAAVLLSLVLSSPLFAVEAQQTAKGVSQSALDKAKQALTTTLNFVLTPSNTTSKTLTDVTGTPQVNQSICARIMLDKLKLNLVAPFTNLIYRTSEAPERLRTLPASNQICFSNVDGSSGSPGSDSSLFLLLVASNCAAPPFESDQYLRPCKFKPVLLFLVPTVPNNASAVATPEARAVVVWQAEESSGLGDEMPYVARSWISANPGYQLVIDGREVQPESDDSDTPQPVELLPCQKSTKIEAYRAPNICRRYLPNGEVVSVDVALNLPSDADKYCASEQAASLDNGITVGNPKIFDTFALRNLLAATANQLATIVPFNPTAITNAYGSLQGVERDVSYLSAQVSTVAGPNMTSNLSAPGATTQTTTPVSAPSAVSQAIQCPANYVPSYTQGSSSSTWTCVAANGNTAPATITTTTTPASGSSTVVNSSSPSLTTQSVQNGVAGSAPTAPASTALSAPTSTSVSASDMLAEQMQLSSQLTTLQMLLQGADSDKLLVSNGRAIGIRKQTTVSFPITLRPPQPFKHAVAEVRVLMIPRKMPDLPTSKMDVVNLLPSEKTYNVAKITSKQKAFGAGVVVEALSLGVAGGKSRDRLYIAKDTDTVALQYPTTKMEGILSPWPSRIGPAANNLVMGKSGALDTDENCTELPPPYVFKGYNFNSGQLNTDLYDFSDAVMFGWQFRPVLGADYVASNIRNVFAQIALPADQDSMSPLQLDVFVQTRWREYSPSAQVTGPSYSTTCQWTVLENGITIDNPIKVKNVEVMDNGGGILRFRAEGDLLASSFNVRYGSTLVPPQYFDGKQIEFFANAADILHGGDIQLVGEDGSETPLLIPARSRSQCGIAASTLKAIPRPDGTALAIASVTRAAGYKAGKTTDGKDGLPDYKILIGSDVYGLLETPFLMDPSKPCDKPSCDYQFESQLASLQTARNYLVRDLAWDAVGSSGTIHFAPAFNSITSLPDESKKTTSKEPTSTWYEVKGTNFNQIKELDQLDVPRPSGVSYPHLFAYQDNSAPIQLTLDPWPVDPGATPVTGANLRVVDQNTLRINFDGMFPPASDAAGPAASKTPSKTIHLVWQESPETAPVDWPLKVANSADSTASNSAPKFSADPPLLYVTDSRTVKFSFSSTVGCFVSAQSEDGIDVAQAVQSIAVPSSAPDTTSFTLHIPKTLTDRPGYKEIVAQVRKPSSSGGKISCPSTGTTNPITIGILVVGDGANRQ